MAAALRLVFGTPADLVWDEPFMRPVVTAIVEGGWTVAHLVDYADTKGPVFFWIHAAWGELAGVAIGSLRALSIGFFVATGVPTGLLAQRLGFDRARTALLALATALLPYAGVLGQLFMSEPSFVFGAMWLVVIVARGLDDDRVARCWAPIAYGALLVVLLHHRPHIVAFAGAALLVVTERRGAASWPWWVATIVAGLLRLPLYLHWGGMVSPEYQDRLGLGLRLEPLAYLLVALLPLTWVTAAALLVQSRARRRDALVVGAGALAGLVLGVVAVPDLAIKSEAGRFLGPVASVLRAAGGGTAAHALFALGAATGGAALAALGITCAAGRLVTTAVAVRRLAGWTVLGGWLLYGLTRGDVYDRYLLPFAIILPVVWITRVPRGLLVAQLVALGGLTVALAATWL